MRFGLKFNPLPIVPAEDLSISMLKVARICDYDVIISDLTKFRELLDKQKFRFIVAGPWGVGKSLITLYFMKLLIEKYGESKVLMVSISPTPGEVDEIVRLILMKVGDLIDLGRIRCISKSELKGYREKILSSLSEGKLGILYHHLTGLFNRVVAEEGKIIYLRFDQLESAVQEILGDQRRMRLLAEFLRNVSVLGDELTHGYATGMAILDSAWANLSKVWGSIEGLAFYKLAYITSVDDVRNLLRVYLEDARIENIPPELADKIKDNPVYPFTDDALEELLRVSEGRPRYICRYAHYALERAALMGIDEVTSDEVRLVVRPELKYWIESMTREPRRDKRTIQQVVTDILEYARKSLHEFEYSVISGRLNREFAKMLGIEGPQTSDGRYIRIPADWIVKFRNEYIALRYVRGPVARRDVETLCDLMKVRIRGNPISRVVIMTLIEPRISARQALGLLRLAGMDVELRIIKEDPEYVGRLLALWLRIRRELPGYLMRDEDLVSELKEGLKLLGIIKEESKMYEE